MPPLSRAGARASACPRAGQIVYVEDDGLSAGDDARMAGGGPGRIDSEPGAARLGLASVPRPVLMTARERDAAKILRAALRLGFDRP